MSDTTHFLHKRGEDEKGQVIEWEAHVTLKSANNKNQVVSLGTFPTKLKAINAVERYRKRIASNDVETALIVLREDKVKQTQHIDTVHQIFNTSDKIDPSTLNAILGIDIEINNITEKHSKDLDRAYRRQIFSLIVVSVVGALFFLLVAMWIMEFGIFYGRV